MKRPTQYTVLAEYYDRLNAHVDTEAYADYLHRTVMKYGSGEENIWLDLACGTGTITLALAKRGHDMIGADLSADMLLVAREKAYDQNQSILWLCQDMREFELYGTVDAVVCCLDSLNYLPDYASLVKCFTLVNNYLGRGGIFLFDMNTPYQFEHIYGDNDYILEEDDVLCAWRNHYDKEKQVCSFDLSIFANQDEHWIRFDEEQTEYCYSLETVKRALHEAGLSLIKVVSDYDESPIEETTCRWYFICAGTGK